MASSNERKLFRVSVICILIIAVITSMIISLIWGSTPVSLTEIWHTLWSSELTDTASQIIWNIRLPRNIVAALVGACLAVSGAILQAVMKNPLADPQIVAFPPVLDLPVLLYLFYSLAMIILCLSSPL